MKLSELFPSISGGLEWARHYAVSAVWPDNAAKAVALSLGGVASWFLPSEALLTGYVVLMGATVVDNLTAIAAVYNTPGKAIKSSKFPRTLIKAGTYTLTVIVAALVGQAFQLAEAFPNVEIDTDMTKSALVGAVIASMTARELWSNIENLNDAGFPLPEFVTKALREYRNRFDPPRPEGHEEKETL